MRRRKATTLASLKEDARIALRDLARSGTTTLREQIATLADLHAPKDEDELFSLSRHSPSLIKNENPEIPSDSPREKLVRANLILALTRVLEEELAAIEKGGPEYLELADRNRGCC